MGNKTSKGCPQTETGDVNRFSREALVIGIMFASVHTWLKRFTMDIGKPCRRATLMSTASLHRGEAPMTSEMFHLQ